MRRLASFVTMAVVGTALAVSNAGAAHADPGNCVWGRYDAHSGFARCYAGSGWYRAKATCYGSSPVVYGPYVASGQTSIAVCTNLNEVKNVYLEIK